ncbi:MAG: FtsQ-type POTRA domain-containing protein [Candidatus Didemnitutus sp.]|nr:FtsQ-type POTRA domain-containing protein [Candidatus Didemnitutus sp.]
MSEEKDNAASERSWRTIRQDVTPRAMSARGRRRRQIAWLKVVSLVALTSAAGWGIYEMVHTWENDRAAIASAVKSEPVKDIVVVTDGVLGKDWAARLLALPRNTTLMALDLAALREKLIAVGQVRVAVLTRNFPDTLVINLQERTPVARIQVEDRLEKKQLLVAKDGVVYEGVGYDKALLATLPWLADFRLRRTEDGQGYAPIDGMKQVSDLLTTAQLQAPHLYREWLFVSLARLATHEEIAVKAQDIPEIVFSAKQDFFRQIAQLDMIVDETKRTLTDPQIQSVNLALGPQVPVKLAQTPEQLTKQAQAGTFAPAFQISPSSSPKRKPSRDL